MTEPGHGFESRQHEARALGEAGKNQLDALSHRTE